MYRRLLNIKRPSARLTCLPVNYASTTLSYFPTRSQILRVDLSTVRVSSRFVIEVQQGYTHYRIGFLKFTARCSKAGIRICNAYDNAMHSQPYCKNLRHHESFRELSIPEKCFHRWAKASVRHQDATACCTPNTAGYPIFFAFVSRYSLPAFLRGTPAIHFCSPSHERCRGAALHSHKVNVAREKNRHNPERHECERQLGHLDHRVGPRNR